MTDILRGNTSRMHTYVILFLFRTDNFIAHQIADGYRFGGIGIHLWNVTPDTFTVFQKVCPYIFE